MSRLLSTAMMVALCVGLLHAGEQPNKTPAKVAIGEAAPAFQFKDQAGKTVNLADLIAKGPVLVRLTCGCAGCDKELAYFQEIDAAYKAAGLTSVAIFKEPDAKVAKYAQ